MPTARPTATTSIRNRSASVRGWLEPAAARADAGTSVQFERLGYFVADRRDHRSDAPVFNRSVTLRDTWTKGG